MPVSSPRVTDALLQVFIFIKTSENCFVNNFYIYCREYDDDYYLLL